MNALSEKRLVRGLSRERYIVDHLANGKDALSGDFDLLILDRMMPGRDGLSVLKSPPLRRA